MAGTNEKRDSLTVKELQGLRRDLDQRGFAAGGRILKDVQFIGGTTRRIPHGLNRRLEGYLVVGIRDNSALGYFDDEHDNRHPDLNKYAYITAHGMNCYADILVF